jgi:hypothetical protein
MRRGLWAQNLDVLRAESWEGVISARELVRLGVPERTVYRRTQQDGPWTLLYPGTLVLAKGTPTLRQLEIAALVHGGPGAMLTGLSGARHHGLRRGGDPAFDHVLIALDRRVLSVGRAVYERTISLPRPVERDGLPVAPLARCLIQHVRRLKDHEAIAAVLTEAVQRRMVPLEALWTELEQGTRKGTAAPRRVLEAARVGVLSPAEYTAREFWESFGDLVRQLGFVWETDSVEHHFATPEQVRETLIRQRRLRAIGLHVLGTRPSQRRDDPLGLHEDLLANLEIAAALPPPRALFGPGPVDR